MYVSYYHSGFGKLHAIRAGRLLLNLKGIDDDLLQNSNQPEQVYSLEQWSGQEIDEGGNEETDHAA